MTHDHSAGPSGHDGNDRSTWPLLAALVINTVFFVVVLAGAFVADSVALLAEAAHMLTDSISLVLALLAAWVAQWRPDANRTYGYARAEVLGGLANGVLLLGVVGYVLYEAIERAVSPAPVDANVVILVGLVGVVANLAAAWVLLGHRHSLNVEGAFLHLVADAAGSVAAVLLGVALLFTNWYILDPLFALLIAALVVYSVRELLFDSLNILLQGTPRDVDLDRLAADLGEIDGVTDAHDVHVWAIDSTRTALSAHLVLAEGADPQAILERARAIAGDHDVDHATIQVESPAFTETCALDCYSTGEEWPAG